MKHRTRDLIVGIYLLICTCKLPYFQVLTEFVYMRAIEGTAVSLFSVTICHFSAACKLGTSASVSRGCLEGLFVVYLARSSVYTKSN